MSKTLRSLKRTSQVMGSKACKVPVMWRVSQESDSCLVISIYWVPATAEVCRHSLTWCPHHPLLSLIIIFMEEEVALKVELPIESKVRLEQKAFCQAGTLTFSCQPWEPQGSKVVLGRNTPFNGPGSCLQARGAVAGQQCWPWKWNIW